MWPTGSCGKVAQLIFRGVTIPFCWSSSAIDMYSGLYLVSLSGRSVYCFINLCVSCLRLCLHTDVMALRALPAAVAFLLLYRALSHEIPSLRFPLCSLLRLALRQTLSPFMEHSSHVLAQWPPSVYIIMLLMVSVIPCRPGCIAHAVFVVRYLSCSLCPGWSYVLLRSIIIIYQLCVFLRSRSLTTRLQLTFVLRRAFDTHIWDSAIHSSRVDSTVIMQSVISQLVQCQLSGVTSIVLCWIS